MKTWIFDKVQFMIGFYIYLLVLLVLALIADYFYGGNLL